METINDIVREMRIGDLCAEDTSASRPEYINDFLASYADRIEAAWKRESEAGAEAAQICGEIGEMIGREATCSKSSQVGNADTVREIAQEMLNTSMQDITAERINGWAMRLAEACEQPVTDCNQLGNAAAMREALSEISNLADALDIDNPNVVAILDQCRDALAEPERNCDVGTAEEQGARHSKWCRKYGIDGDMEVACAHQDMSCTLCALRWAQMPYESEVK